MDFRLRVEEEEESRHTGNFILLKKNKVLILPFATLHRPNNHNTQSNFQQQNGQQWGREHEILIKFGQSSRPIQFRDWMNIEFLSRRSALSVCDDFNFFSINPRRCKLFFHSRRAPSLPLGPLTNNKHVLARCDGKLAVRFLSMCKLFQLNWTL